MDIDRIKAFVWTVEEGAIVGAARRLHRSQPAVSRLLQQLEDQLGGALIDRSVRPLAPTERGLSVLPAARMILRARDEMLDAAALAQRPAVLRVGVSRSLVGRLAGPEFRGAGKLRDVQLRIRSGWSPRLCTALAQGELDCAVVLMPLDWRAPASCRAALLRRERLVVIAPSATRPGDMLDGRWILNPDGCGFRAALAEALRRRGTPLEVPIEVDAAPWEHTRLVASGMGMSVVPASALPARGVREVRLPRIPMVTGVWLVAADGHGLDGACGLIGRALSGVDRTERGRAS